MTKLRNKIVLVLLALCFAVCAGLFVACGGDTPTDNSVTYTVTITAGDAAAEGVQVTVKKGSTTLGKPATTDSNGKAEFKLAEDAGYTVTLDGLPRGYKVADGAELKFDADRKLEVALEEKPVSYTIKLVKPDKTPYTAAGVLVGICTVESNNCLELVEPDAYGIVKIYDAAKTDYHIQIKGLPAGYAFESDGTYAIKQNESGNYTQSNGTTMVPVYVELTDTVVEQTITIYPVNVIQLTDAAKLTDEEFESDYWWMSGMAAYKMNIEVDANATAYYEYTADYSGDYYFYADNENLVCKLNESFLLGDSYLDGTGAFYPPITMEKGKTYYLNVTNNGEEKETVEAVMTTPYATNFTVTGAGTVKAEVNKQGKNAVIVLEPTSGSTYKLTVTGNGAIKQAVSSYAVENVEFADADYTSSKELTVKYTEDMQGNLYFAVSVKASEYPASVEVKIERIGTHTNQTIIVQPANLTKTADNDDFNKELAPVAMNATVVKGTDGKYHIGTETGPVVYANLTGTIGAARYEYNSYELVYMEEATNAQYSYYLFDVTSAADKAAADKGNTYKDFRTALRGFEEYKFGISMTRPVDLAENYYAKNTNSDGVYPLDDVLKEYLELAAEQLDTEWLFACYYYADYADPDAIVGEYETEDREFTLTVEKFGEFTIQDAYGYIDLGTWTKSESGDYTFTCKYADEYGSQLTYVDGSFTYTDDMGTDLTFEVPADPIVGDYATEDGAYTLTIYKNNEFTIMEEAGEYVSGTWSKTDDEYTFTIPNDEFHSVMTYSDGVITFSDDFCEDGPLTFIRSEGGEDEVDITGVYKYHEGMDNITLTVNADWTVTFVDGLGTVTGFWVDNQDGTFEFTINFEEDNSTVYTVYVNEGALEFYDAQGLVYTFEPVGEQDPAPDTEIFSTETWANDATINLAKLWLYDDGKCILWQYSFRNQAFEKIATANYSVNQDDGNVTITGITAVNDYDGEVTADYNQGVITITLKQDEMPDMVYTFNMQQA